MIEAKKTKGIIIGQAVAIIILIAALAIAIATQGKFLSGKSKMNKNIAQQAVNYINSNFIQQGKKAVLEKTSEVNGVYKIKIKIGNKEFTSYLTKDGALLFPQAINLKPPKPKSFAKTKKPNVDLFVMAFCPFGNQAEELMMPVEKLLKNQANFTMHYIIYSNYASGYPKFCIDKANKYCSMHGAQEVHQDIRELCVQKYQPNKFWDFVKAIDDKATAQNVDSKWEGIAQSLGINVAKIKDCQKNEGIKLLDQEIALTNKSYPVQQPSKHQGNDTDTITGSPTLVINGTIYDGSRSSEAFKKAICSAFTKAPIECSKPISQTKPSAPSGAVCK